MIVENNELIIHIENALMAANRNDEAKESITIGQYGLIYLSTLKYNFKVEISHHLVL